METPPSGQTQTSENELIVRAKSGDLQAFELLIKSYQQKVYGMAYYMAGNHSDAEDLFQEGFIRALENISQFKGQSSFGTWLYSVCRNTFLNELKKRSRARREVSFSGGEDENPIESMPEPGKDDSIERKKMQLAVEQVLCSLPEKLRAPIVLCDLQGYDYDGAAGVLNTTVAAVRTRLSRARRILKEAFEGMEII